MTHILQHDVVHLNVMVVSEGEGEKEIYMNKLINK